MLPGTWIGIRSIPTYASGSAPTPTPAGPFVSDAYRYDTAAATGVIGTGAVQPPPAQGTPTGTISGNVIQPEPTQDAPTGTISGNVIQPSETRYD